MGGPAGRSPRSYFEKFYTDTVDARPVLVEIGRLLERVKLEAVLIGNAAAALQGAPVTTLDLDFLFRRTPRNLGKLKTLARELGATVMRPFYPASDMYRVVRDEDGLQLDFMGSVHGIRSFEGVRDRANRVEIDGVGILVASLVDINKPVVSDFRRTSWVRPKSDATEPKSPKASGRRRTLAALAKESDRALRDQKRRWQALPPERRTNFLRKRVRLRGSAW